MKIYRIVATKFDQFVKNMLYYYQMLIAESIYTQAVDA